MATDSVSNPLPPNPSIDDDIGSDSGAESTTMTTSSSPTHDASLVAKGEIPELSDFFKGTTVSEEELQAYHSDGWLTGNALSSIPEVDVPTVAGSTILCFKSHLLAGLGLPPSKFLAAIMNYLGCSLVHFNANVITALSSFVMLCEYWLGILLDSSLFWYYYSILIRQIHLCWDRAISAPIPWTSESSRFSCCRAYFGCLFEAFQHVSQAVRISSSAVDDA
jgi:hypothetical protein